MMEQIQVKLNTISREKQLFGLLVDRNNKILNELTHVVKVINKLINKVINK